MPAGRWNDCGRGYPRCRCRRTKPLRQELADIVKREIDRLEFKLKEHEEIG